MAYEQKPGDIAIFANEKKEKDSHPDWRGSLIVPDGVKPGDKLDVAMWAKGGKGTMLAGGVQIPRMRQVADAIDTQNASRREPNYGDIEDSEIPF